MASPLIAHILWTLDRGGAEKMVFDLARFLPSRDFRVLVIAANGGGEMAHEFIAAGIQTIVGPERLTSRDRSQTLAFLRQTLREHRPDLLHTHLGGDVWGGLAARFEGIHPWIVTAHSLEENLPFLSRLTRRLALRQADRVVSVSQSVADAMSRQYAIRPSQSIIIPVGVDLDHIPRRGQPVAHDVPRLVTVGRLVKAKGHAHLFKALAAVKRPWKLSVIGDGPERSTLHHLAESLGILPRVEFVGSVPDVMDRLAKADGFCFPSESEGLGVSVLEAATAGVPILVSDLPVFHEMFDDRSVQFVPVGDVEAWKKALFAFLSDPHVALKRAVVAEKIIRERFSLTTMVDAYSALYQKLLQS